MGYRSTFPAAQACPSCNKLPYIFMGDLCFVLVLVLLSHVHLFNLTLPPKTHFEERMLELGTARDVSRRRSMIQSTIADNSVYCNLQHTLTVVENEKDSTSTKYPNHQISQPLAVYAQGHHQGTFNKTTKKVRIKQRTLLQNKTCAFLPTMLASRECKAKCC